MGSVQWVVQERRWIPTDEAMCCRITHTYSPLGGRSDRPTLLAPEDARQAECHAAHGFNQDRAHRIATECPRLRPIRDSQREQNFTISTSPAHPPQTLPAYPIPRSPHQLRYEDRRRPPVIHRTPEASCAAPTRSSALEGRTATAGYVAEYSPRFRRSDLTLVEDLGGWNRGAQET